MYCAEGERGKVALMRCFKSENLGKVLFSDGHGVAQAGGQFIFRCHHGSLCFSRREGEGRLSGHQVALRFMSGLRVVFMMIWSLLELLI